MAFKFSPEVQARVAANRQRHARLVAQARSMSTETLNASVRYCLQQMRELWHFAPGEVVYDATFWHVYLPELMRRAGVTDWDPREKVNVEDLLKPGA